MKTKMLVSVVALLAMSSFAHADINGFWAGNFSETGSDGSTSVSPGFVLGVSTSAGQINFCEPMGFTYLDGLTFTVQGSALYLDNHAVGSVSTSADGTTSLSISLIDDIDGIFDQVSVTANLDGSLSYTDYLADFYGDFINSTSIMQTATSKPTGTHAPRGTLLKAFFDSLKKKPQPTL